jgi:chemotaxis protein MotB
MSLTEERLRLIDANQKLQEQVDSLTDTLVVLDAELSQIRTALQGRQQTQEAERRRLQQLADTRRDENETLRQDVERTRTALAEVHQTRTALQQQLQTVRAEVQQWQQRHTDTARSLREAQTALEQARAEATTAQQALQDQLAQRTQALEQLRAQQTQTTQQLQDTVKQLEAAVEQRDQALAQAQQALTTAQQEAQAARAAAQQAQQQQTTSAQAAQAAQAALEQARTEAATVRQALEARQAQQAQETTRLQALQERLSQELSEAIQQQAVSIQGGTDRLTVRLGGEALFGTGAVSVRPESRPMLDKIVTVLQGTADYVFRIEGHTDDIPLGGSARERWPTNWELSAARAASVVRYLQEKGLPPEQLAIGGYAFYRPVATNDTPEGRGLNRRIEIVLLPMTSAGDQR